MKHSCNKFFKHHGQFLFKLSTEKRLFLRVFAHFGEQKANLLDIKKYDKRLRKAKKNEYLVF